MKKLFILAAIAALLTSCQTQRVRNHSGIREWKAGKMMPHNRRPHERPQCIDSW